MPEQLTRAQKIRKLKELMLQDAMSGQQQDNEPQDGNMDLFKAAMHSFNQGLTANLSDEITAAARAGYKKITEGGDLGDLYYSEREALREYGRKVKEDHPYLSLGGELAGAAATLPAAGALKLGQLGSAAKGFIGGGAAGYGASESDSAVGQLRDTAVSGVAGGALGAAAPMIGKQIGKAGSSVGKKLQDVAETRAFKAATGQNKRAFKEATQMGTLKSRGADLLASDEAGKPVVGFGSSVKDIIPKAKVKKEFYGKKLGEVGEALDKNVPEAVDGDKIADKILNYATDKVQDTPKNKNVIKKLLEEAEFYTQKGKMSFQEAQKLKGSYMFKPTDQTTQVLGQDGTNAVRRAVKEQMEDSVDELAKSETTSSATRKLLDKYKQYKNKYGSFKGAEKTAEDRAFADVSNRFISPSDYGVGTAMGLVGAATGGGFKAAALAAAGAGANKIARERGSAFAARSADLLRRAGTPTAQTLQKAPFAELGAYELGTQTPEFLDNITYKRR